MGAAGALNHHSPGFDYSASSGDGGNVTTRGVGAGQVGPQGESTAVIGVLQLSQCEDFEAACMEIDSAIERHTSRSRVSDELADGLGSRSSRDRGGHVAASDARSLRPNMGHSREKKRLRM